MSLLPPEDSRNTLDFHWVGIDSETQIAMLWMPRPGVWFHLEEITPEEAASRGYQYIEKALTPVQAHVLEQLFVSVLTAIREEVRCLSHLRNELLGRVEGEAATKFFPVIDRAIERLGAHALIEDESDETV